MHLVRATGGSTGTSQTTGSGVCTGAIEMVPVAGGWFQMGMRDEEPMDWRKSGDELPRHFVYLSPYCIAKYEVTNQQYCDVLNYAHGQGYLKNSSDGPYTGGDVYAHGEKLLVVSNSWCQIKYNGSSFYTQVRQDRDQTDHPAVMMSWSGAVAFTNWLSEMESLTPCYDLPTWERIEPVPNGYRLPTEAEWERASGWDTSLDWAVSEDPPCVGGHWIFGVMSDQMNHSRANYNMDNPLSWSSQPYTTPIGYYNGMNPGTVDSPSPVGCYDMCGNTWEWTHDFYDLYGADPVVDPMITPVLTDASSSASIPASATASRAASVPNTAIRPMVRR